MCKNDHLEEIMDADGNSLFPGGLWRRTGNDNGFKIYEDEHGKKYWINGSGERDYELPYITVGKRTENGSVEMMYDSRCNPPLLAKG